MDNWQEKAFDFSQLEEFRQQLAEVVNEYPGTCEKHLKKIGNKFKKLLKEKSPDGADNSHIKDEKERKKADAKKLKNRWKSEVKGFSGEALSMDIWTTSRHFHLVDRGHVQKTKSGKVVGFVQGKHFLAAAAQELESNVVPTELEKLFKDIGKKIGD